MNMLSFLQKSKKIRIDTIGNVSFRKSKRSKRVCISIRPFTGIHVSVPLAVSFKQAEKIVHSKKPWIIKHMHKMTAVEDNLHIYDQQMACLDTKHVKTVLQDRLHELAEKHGFEFSRVTIRNQKTRWGSCSARNAISLNSKLAILPAHLRDYVILHELVHTKIKNHGKDFWQHLKSLTGDTKNLRKELKKYPLF